MTVGEFLDKVDELYEGQYRIDITTPTYVHFKYSSPELMQWIGKERYDVKDENGEIIILKRFSPNSYLIKSTQYNVAACFTTLAEIDDDCFNYYFSLYHVAKYARRAVEKGEMKLDEQLYLMNGQSVDEDDLFEIKEIVADYESVDIYAGDMIDKDDCLNLNEYLFE